MTSIEQLQKHQASLAVVGLGYVGLPLAAGFGRFFSVIGFDINETRIQALRNGNDWTGEVETPMLTKSNMTLTSDPRELANASVIIIAVPTPVDRHHNPDLTLVVKASTLVGQYMPRGCVVVYESTVYPGVTEDICIPCLEQASGMRHGTDFSVGYSPERINPGDKEHTLETIVKVVSGSDARTTDLLEQLYGAVVQAGTHRAPSIRVAEAAKVIENTQRDLNIALMNELAVLFKLMNIDTQDVLAAAGTKWNFLPFTPGLVGGHCIGVDPYYLTFKAEELGYFPQVILAGRQINDSMGKYVAEHCIKQLIRRGYTVKTARIGILGFTFRENIPDFRNTRVMDIVNELQEYDTTVIIHDPLASCEQVHAEYGISLSAIHDMRNLDALIIAVAHKSYQELTPQELRCFFAQPDNAVLLDIKACLSKETVQSANMVAWKL